MSDQLKEIIFEKKILQIIPNTKKVLALFTEHDGTKTELPVLIWALIEQTGIRDNENYCDRFVEGLTLREEGNPELEFLDYYFNEYKIEED